VVLEAAVNGRADLLVTFNQADFAAAAKLLRSRAESEGRFWCVRAKKHHERATKCS